MTIGFDVASYGTGIGGTGWVVNLESVDEPTSEYLDKCRIYPLEKIDHCPFCSCKTISREFKDVSDNEDESWYYDRNYVWSYCCRCAFFTFEGFEGGNKCMDSGLTSLVSSVNKKFDGNFPGVCSTELSQALRRNHNRWHELNPKRLESLVADIFRANYDHSEVIHIGKPCDGEIDVVFVESNGKKWLIQVKRRENPAKSEPVSTLRELLGTLVVEGEQSGIVVTTSDAFSYYARAGSDQAKSQGYEVELLDKGVLDRMVGKLLPDMPWETMFKSECLTNVDEEVREFFLANESKAIITILKKGSRF